MMKYFSIRLTAAEVGAHTEEEAEGWMLERIMLETGTRKKATKVLLTGGKLRSQTRIAS